MNKVLFITRYPLVGNYNLNSKFNGQMQAFKNLGYDVYNFAYDEHNYYMIHEDERTVLRRVRFTKSGLYHHILSYVSLYKAVLKALDIIQPGEGDFAYMRAFQASITAGK